MTVAVFATACSGGSSPDAPSSSSAATSEAAEEEELSYCQGVGFNDAPYYVTRPAAQGCSGIDTISRELFESLQLNEQCTLGSATYYGDLSDIDSLDSALGTCVEAGGEQSPGRR
ncbi:hypothetical protein SEA_PHISHY_39 [Gordonia phage Phishy]|nr:hypothetical protein SEA_PHISHY_39 [Gordonia phage Phishy]